MQPCGETANSIAPISAPDNQIRLEIHVPRYIGDGRCIRLFLVAYLADGKDQPVFADCRH